MIPIWFVAILAIVVVAWFFNGYVKPSDARILRGVNVGAFIVILVILIVSLNPSACAAIRAHL